MAFLTLIADRSYARFSKKTLHLKLFVQIFISTGFRTRRPQVSNRFIGIWLNQMALFCLLTKTKYIREEFSGHNFMVVHRAKCPHANNAKTNYKLRMANENKNTTVLTSSLLWFDWYLLVDWIWEVSLSNMEQNICLGKNYFYKVE